MHSSALIFACSMYVQAAFGQLHLVTGSPFSEGSATFPSALLRVEEDGAVVKAAEIASPSVGTEWIGVSYDWRKAVFLSARGSTVIVVDFDKGAVVKKCKTPNPAGRSLINSWLAGAPLGPSYEWLETGTDVIRDAVVQGMLLDPAVPCEKSFAMLEPEAIRYAIAHGKPGIADVVNFDGVRTNTTEDEVGTISAFTNRHVPLGYEVPLALRRGFRVMAEGMAVNDSRVFVLSMGDGKDDYRVLIFRKSDKTWRTLPRLSERAPYIRGFGKYLAVTEIRSSNGQDLRSAGMDKWRAGSDHIRPDLRTSVAQLNQHIPMSFPGRLHLYNVETEQVFSIATNQGDSEVLLVENGMVYYRAADELYSAPITDKGIGRARLLATDDSIRDAHWAFVKP
jgi:hypothetical protein